MAFSEERLDTGYIIYGTQGGPEFSTDIVELNSGFENRNANWNESKGKWDYGDRKLPDTELRLIIKFFKARKGRANGFRFKDWGDFKVDVTEGILGLSGHGTATATYQLYKQYVSGADKDYKKITKPVVGTLKIFKNGVQAPTSGFGAVAFDYTTGIVTFSPDSIGNFPQAGDVLTWSGEFDVPVRFDSDQVRYRFDSSITSSPGVVQQAFFFLASLPLVEIRV